MIEKKVFLIGDKGVHAVGYLLEILCPIIALLSLNEYLLWSRDVSHSILLVGTAVVMGWLVHLLRKQNERRLKWVALGFGLLFALAQVCGARLEAAGTIATSGETVKSFALLGTSVLMLVPVAGGLFVGLVQWITKMTARPEEKRKMTAKQLFWLSFAMIMICWLPALLAYWPGIYSYDVGRQISQVVEGIYDEHHPILHTLLLGGFHRLGQCVGSENVGIVMYCIFQMMITALTMSAILSHLWSWKCPRWLCVVLLVMFGTMPFHQLLVISTTKDVLFADTLAMWMLLMVKGIREPKQAEKKSWRLMWIVCAALSIVLRTNGLAAVVVAIFGGWQILRRNRKLCRCVICLTFCALLLGLGTMEGLSMLLDAAPGPLQEVLNIPIQQIARVHHILRYESRDEIRYFLPDIALYQPALSDYVKHTANISVSELPQFFQLWLKLGLKYPMIYLDAYGLHTKGYWYLDDISHATFRGELLEYHEGYLGTIFRSCFGVVPDSQWPLLYDWYEQMYSVNKYLEIPFLSVITSTSLWCWMVIALMFVSIYLRRNETLLPLVVMFGILVLYLMISPCCSVRYVYPFMFVVPLCLGVLITPLHCRTNNDIISSK